MKNRLFFTLTIIAILFACTRNDLASTVDESNLNAKMILSPLFDYNGETYSANLQKQLNKNAVARKLLIRNSGIITFAPDSEYCAPYIQVLIQGQGNATHLGLFTISISYCSDGENPVGPILGIQTAANGDQLFTALVGAGFDPELGPYMDFIYFGGTGRFVDASGEITLFGLVDYAEMVFDLHGEGTLIY